MSPGSSSTTTRSGPTREPATSTSGKVSFGEPKLRQNADAILGAIKAAKPASLKGAYVKSGYLTTTMGPAIKTEI